MPFPDAVPLVSVGTVLVVLVVVVIVVGAVVLLRSGNPHAWPAILLSTVTAAVCFTVGGESAVDSEGPSVATVTGAVVGTLSLIAMTVSLVPRSVTGRPPRVPMLLATGAIAIGAVGLLINEVVG